MSFVLAESNVYFEGCLNGEMGERVVEGTPPLLSVWPLPRVLISIMIAVLKLVCPVISFIHVPCI